MGQTKNTLTLNLPLVSAVITTHNRLDLLKRAVKSVYAQSYKNIELIVVDDGSADGTEGWCKSQSFTYIRIPQGESKGGNYARNLGAKNSQGTFLAFLDDDDYWLPEKIEFQINLAQNHPNCVIYSFRTYEIIKDERVIKYQSEEKQLNMKGDISVQCLLSPCVTSTSTMLIPTEVFWNVKGWDENQKFWQDNDLIVRLAQKVEFWFVNEEMVVYTVNLTDTKRLSNKYHEWKSSAKRFYKKHSTLYSKLTFKQKVRVKQLYLTDASLRARSNNLIVSWVINAISSRILKNLFKLYSNE